ERLEAGRAKTRNGEDPTHHWLEDLQGLRLVFGIETAVVVHGGEHDGILIPGVIPVDVTSIAIYAELVAVVENLKRRVPLDDPTHPLRHVGFENRGTVVAMRVRRELIADVVKEGGHDVFFIATIEKCSGSGLKGMLVPSDREPRRFDVQSTHR